MITLDIEMPEMDGLEMLRRLRQTYPDLRVIMFSTLTERGAASTMEALSLGADDYVTKASNEGSLDRSMATLRSELIPKIKQFFTLGAEPAALPAVARKHRPARVRPAVRQNAFRPYVAPEVVAIGVSTGGPNALGAIMPDHPGRFPASHPDRAAHAARFHASSRRSGSRPSTKLKVEEATEGAVGRARQSADRAGRLSYARAQEGSLVTTVTLDQGPPENSCRPAVDVCSARWRKSMAFA